MTSPESPSTVGRMTALPPHQLGRLVAVTGMFVVSLDSILTRAANAEGFVVSFWFGVFMTPAIVIVLRLTGGESMRAHAKQLPVPMALSALTQAGSSMLFLLAVKNTTIANVVVILAAAPILAAIAGRLLIAEHTSRRVWLAIGASLTGIAIVMSGSFGGGRLTGDLLAVGAITSWSLNLIVYRRHPTLNRFASVAWGGVIIAGLSAVALALTMTSPFDVSARSFGFLVLLGAVTGPLSRLLIANATRFMTAAEVTLFGPIETVSATLLAWLVFAERPPTETFIGGAIVIAAVVFGTRHSASSNRRPSNGTPSLASPTSASPSSPSTAHPLTIEETT